LNAREGFPVIHYPKDCGSFPALEKFSVNFDPHVNGTVWKPLADNEEVKIKDDVIVQAIRSNHVPVDEGKSKSLGFKVFQTKTKLKPEIANLPKEKIKELMMGAGKHNLVTEVRTNLITYTGDTPVDDYEKWNNSGILIHEATFLETEEKSNINSRANKHSKLEEVIEMVSHLNVETLILGHFSSRYTAEEVDERIRQLCKKFSIKIPVHRVLPGSVHRNILQENPINN
jgi:ribonuclease Z